MSFAGLCLLSLTDIRDTKSGKYEKLIYWLFTLLYVFAAISFFYSEDQDEAVRKLILKLPLLFFPLFYLTLKKTTFNTRIYLVAILNYGVFLPSSVSVYNYISNKKLFDQLILESKPLPIEFGYGIYHIQFSILLAAAVVFGLYAVIRLFRKGRKDIITWTILTLTVVNAVNIHILSARTGLVAMYAGLLAVIAGSLKGIELKYKIMAVAVCILAPAALFLSSTSLQNRLKNSLVDLKVVMSGSNANEYSFAMRVEGWKNAIDIIDRHPLEGVGIGDADKELYENFKTFNPSIEPNNRRNPHHQMLENAVQSGVPSALLFLILLIVIMTRKTSSPHGNHLLTGIVLLLFISSNFESILESQASIVAFSAFLALAYVFDRKDPSESPISEPAFS